GRTARRGETVAASSWISPADGRPARIVPGPAMPGKPKPMQSAGSPGADLRRRVVAHTATAFPAKAGSLATRYSPGEVHTHARIASRQYESGETVWRKPQFRGAPPLPAGGEGRDG